MKYGYARVSTLEQDTGMQLSALKRAGCSVIFEEKISAAKNRPKLDELLGMIDKGDCLVVYKLDRLARSLMHLLSIMDHLQRRGANLKSLTEPVDPDTAAGRMFLQVLGSVAEFERSLIRERCIAGQIEAMRRGKMLGRRHKLSLQEQNEVIQLADTGISKKDIAEAYGVCRNTVWRLCAEAKGHQPRQFGKIHALLYNNNNHTTKQDIQDIAIDLIAKTARKTGKK